MPHECWPRELVPEDHVDPTVTPNQVDPQKRGKVSTKVPEGKFLPSDEVFLICESLGVTTLERSHQVFTWKHRTVTLMVTDAD